MSLANEVYWGYIHDHFKNIAAQYDYSPSGSTAAGSSSSEDESTSSPSSSSPPLSPSTSTREPSSPLSEECDCGFDGCGGFCVNLPDTNADNEKDCLSPVFMNGDDHLCYWAAKEEAQATAALVNIYLAAPDPQASVDSIPCQTDFETRVWGECTKALRRKRSEKKAIQGRE